MGEIVNWLNGYIWSSALVYLILGIGLLYTILTRFVQVRFFKEMIKLTFERKDSDTGVSSFQALTMSLGSRVGTGNIAGVATAIALGGPGAVFWMWVTAFLASSTSFIEITLTQVYKSKINGEYRGGTPFYIEKGLKVKWFAIFSAILTLFVMSCLWPSIQTNTMALAMDNAFGISPAITGAIIVVLLAIIIFGGVKRIAKAAEVMVPFMAIGYLAVCIIVLVLNASQIPGVISLIFTSAFDLNATFGGLLGSAIAWGVQRGVYSNAAGMGSETFESGAAEVSHPAKQGLVQAFSVYIDTLVICSATAFMILITGMYNVQPEGMDPIVNNVGDVEPSLYTQHAIESVIPGFGAAFLAIALLFFCFTTIVSYYYKAETNLVFLFKNTKLNSNWLNHLLKVFMLGTAFYGAVKTADTAWAMGDLGMGTMAWVNSIAIFSLTKTALIVLKDYERQRKQGIDPVFNPTALGIKGADFWENDYNQGEYKEQVHFGQAAASKEGKM
ncbi:alanine/glycine:cation symporter family protein [Niallia endozanthoxylica]|uniref:Alanine:cation symporter family protein n=1 Tax=Niallia endozanthoxylica TaxID=2036016 RepID=A0A5J5I969_9BACI|nr:alanine/glycine:cation symporter family protein [Niallia endozanthoxylica]KAA9031156.1 alanine:cation symporter family protein [Niallia endozanthoxylica]